jgi:hypothetical protein
MEVAMPVNYKTSLFAMVAMLLWSAGAAWSADIYVGQGLVPVRNFQPIQGLSLQMAGESAIPLKKDELAVRAHFAETSTILREVTPTTNAVLKFGQLRSVLDLRYGAMDNLEVGVELASLYRHSTGLDGLITGMERLFDKYAPIRQQLRNSGYAYVLNRNGRTLLNGRDDLIGLTDAVLQVKSLLVEEGKYVPAIALRLALKVPVGSQSLVFGTGVADLGVGLAFQKTVWNRVGLYVNANEILPTGHYLGLPLRSYFTSVTGVEFMITPKFSVTGQFDYYQSPFGNTGSRILDRGVTEAVLAFGYRFTPNFLWQIYGVENLDFIRDSAADLTLATAFTYRAPQK